MTSAAIGRTRWAIAEGYIPAWSHGPPHLFTSHETACLLNTSDTDAHVRITLYFSDREPVGPYRVRCRRGGPGTSGSTTCAIRSRCRSRPTTRA